jgi:hypothetical protein
VVVAGGVVSGTWGLDDDTARVTWFREAGRAPKKALDSEVGRLSPLVGRDLGIEVSLG